MQMSYFLDILKIIPTVTLQHILSIKNNIV